MERFNTDDEYLDDEDSVPPRPAWQKFGRRRRSKGFAEDLIDPRDNVAADSLFARDVERLRQCFARYGLRLDARRIAHDIWSRSLPELGKDAGEMPI